MTNAALIEFLPDPVLLLFGNDQTERANRAFRDLAARYGLRVDLISMFGRDASALLLRARRESHAQAFLPLQTGTDDAPVHRVAIRRLGEAERLLVVLTDMSREFSWREQLTRRNRELSVLNDIGAALSSTLDLDTLFQRIYEQAGRILNTVNFFVALPDEARTSLSFPIRVEDGQPLPAGASRPFANGLAEHVLRTREPLLVNGDVAAEARALGLEPPGRPGRSWLGVPMLAEGRTIGVIALQDYTGTGGLGEHDLELLTLIAGQAAAAVRGAQLLARAREAYRELSETQASRLEAERLRGITEAVGGLSHEVNNPLAAIAGNAQLLLRQGESLPAGAEDKVTRILEAARRIQGVTGKMANLIHATSMPYPGEGMILDVSRSLAREGYQSVPTRPAADDAGDPEDVPGEPPRAA